MSRFGNLGGTTETTWQVGRLGLLCKLFLGGTTFTTGAANSNTITVPNTSGQLCIAESGTFTPIVKGATSAGVGTYTSQVGRYTKIGDVVNIRIFIGVSAHTGTGSLRIGNLPFVAEPSANCPLALHNVNGITLTANNYLTAAALAATNEVQLGQSPVGGGAFAAVNMDTSFSLMLAGSYFTT